MRRQSRPFLGALALTLLLAARTVPDLAGRAVFAAAAAPTGTCALRLLAAPLCSLFKQ